MAEGDTWFQGLDEPTKTAIVARGLDKGDAVAAFQNVLKGYQEAQATIGRLGGSPDRLLRLPEQGDQQGWRQVWQRLGVPADPAEYDFAAAKFRSGEEPSAEFGAFMRKLAHDLNIPKTAAVELATRLLHYGEDAEAEEERQMTLARATEMDKLRQSWGANFEGNKFQADRMAALLGFNAQQIAALMDHGDAALLYDGLLKASQKVGEAQLHGIGTGGAGTGGAMTREQAQARLDELKAGKDPEWAARWLKGGKAEADEFAALTRVAVGQRPA